jgi:hypothetical protein
VYLSNEKTGFSYPCMVALLVALLKNTLRTPGLLKGAIATCISISIPFSCGNAFT